MTTSTATAPPVSGVGHHLAEAFRWHRPLMSLAVTMACLVVAGTVGMLTDNRILTGLPIWDNRPSLPSQF